MLKGGGLQCVCSMVSITRVRRCTAYQIAYALYFNGFHWKSVMALTSNASLSREFSILMLNIIWLIFSRPLILWIVKCNNYF